jgi:hypothetical protein
MDKLSDTVIQRALHNAVPEDDKFSEEVQKVHILPSVISFLQAAAEGYEKSTTWL